MERKIYRVQLGDIDEYRRIHLHPDEEVVQVDYHFERGWLLYTTPRTTPLASPRRWWQR